MSKKEISVLDHVDSMTLNIGRTQSILHLVSCEFTDGCEPKGLYRDQIANLLWQAQENVRQLHAEIDAMWDKVKELDWSKASMQPVDTGFDNLRGGGPHAAHDRKDSPGAHRCT